MFLAFFCLFISCEEWVVPEFKAVGSGWNGWANVLLPISGLFDGMKISDWIIHANVNFAEILSTAIDDALHGKIDIREYFLQNIQPSLNSSYVYTGPGTEFAIDFDSITERIGNEITEEGEDTTDYFIGLALGFVFTLALLLVLFVVTLFYWIISCCGCCCCCRPHEFSKPSIFAQVCFYIGIAILVVVTIAVFYMIRPLTSIISSIEHFPEAGSQICSSGNSTINNIFELVDEAPQLIKPAAEYIGPNLTQLVNDVAQYISERVDVVKDIIRNGDENASPEEYQQSFLDILDQLSATLDEVNSLIKDVNDAIDEANQQGQVIPDWEQIENVDYLNFTQELQTARDTVNTTIDMFDPYLDMIEEFGTQFVDQFQPTIDDLIENLEFDFNSSDITDPINKLSNSDTFIYELGKLFDSENPESFSDTWDTINEYLGMAKTIVIVLFVVLGMIWVFTLLCYSYSFNSHSCCGTCIASCNCCCPCFCSIMSLIFGIVGTIISVCIIYANEQIYDTVDKSLNAAVSSFPNRMIDIPRFSVDIKEDDFAFQLVIDPINFTFPPEIKPLTNLIAAEDDVSLCQLWELRSFFKIEENKARLLELPDKINDTIQPSFVNLVDSVGGDIGDQIPSDITQLEGYPTDLTPMLSNVTELLEDLRDNPQLTATRPELKQKINNLLDDRLPGVSKIFEDTVPGIYTNLIGVLETQIISVFTKEGFPEVYDDILYPPLMGLFNSFVSVINNVLDLAIDSTDGIEVKFISGLVSYVSNAVFFDFAEFFTLVSIACHLQLIGLLIVCISLWVRRRGMQPKAIIEENSESSDNLKDFEDVDDKPINKQMYWTGNDDSTDGDGKKQFWTTNNSDDGASDSNNYFGVTPPKTDHRQEKDDEIVFVKEEINDEPILDKDSEKNESSESIEY